MVAVIVLLIPLREAKLTLGTVSEAFWGQQLLPLCLKDLSGPCILEGCFGSWRLSWGLTSSSVRAAASLAGRIR